MRELLWCVCVWTGMWLCGGAAAQQARLELSEPAAREIASGQVPVVEVAGRLAHGGEPLDVVIALDVSESVFLPTGSDLDGDGIAARLRCARCARGSLRQLRRWTTDPDDTVFAAARAAARRVLEALPRGRARVGLLTFGEEVRVRARLGPVERASAALARVRPPLEPVATNLERAIRIGVHVLRAYGVDGRRKLLLILSDGRATRPWAPRVAESAARSAARAAALHGVEIHAVAFGPAAAGAASAYADLAALTRGRFLAGAALPRALAEPPFADPSLPLARAEVANLTTGEPARALRLSANGEFDGFVRLAEGDNRLRIDALTLDGERVSRSRTVRLSPAPASAILHRLEIEVER